MRVRRIEEANIADTIAIIVKQTLFFTKKTQGEVRIITRLLNFIEFLLKTRPD
jgi:hypothetical protein